MPAPATGSIDRLRSTRDIAHVMRTGRRRAALATSEVPGLSAHDARVAAVLETAATADWPALQRIHGDLHSFRCMEDCPQYAITMAAHGAFRG